MLRSFLIIPVQLIIAFIFCQSSIANGVLPGSSLKIVDTSGSTFLGVLQERKEDFLIFNDGKEFSMASVKKIYVHKNNFVKSKIRAGATIGLVLGFGIATLIDYATEARGNENLYFFGDTPDAWVYLMCSFGGGIIGGLVGSRFDGYEEINKDSLYIKLQPKLTIANKKKVTIGFEIYVNL